MRSRARPRHERQHARRRRTNGCGSTAAALLAAALAAGCADDDESGPPTAWVQGHAFAYGEGPSARLADADVWVLERPSLRVVTDGDGGFRFNGLEVGSRLTLVVQHPDYEATQTGSLTLGPTAAEDVTVQALSHADAESLLSRLGETLDPTKCQVLTTASRSDGSLYDDGPIGEPGATVTIDPSWQENEGPVYFDETGAPDLDRDNSSEHGGVLFIQVPPGEYVVRAQKGDTAFSEVEVKCRAGLLVNAAPPWALQAQD